MMYALYKADGSIYITNLAEVVNQGNNGTNKIFVSIEGLTLTDYTDVYTGTANFTLPDGSVTTLIGEEKENVQIGNGTYNGYEFALSQNETKYAGVIYCSIQIIKNSDNSILRTIRFPITINKTNADVDTTLITLAQYNALLSLLNGKQNVLWGGGVDVGEVAHILGFDTSENLVQKKLYKEFALMDETNAADVVENSYFYFVIEGYRFYKFFESENNVSYVYANGEEGYIYEYSFDKVNPGSYDGFEIRIPYLPKPSISDAGKLLGVSAAGNYELKQDNNAKKGSTLIASGVFASGEFIIDLENSTFGEEGLYFFTYGNCQTYLYVTEDMITAATTNPIRTPMPVIYGASGETTVGNLRISRSGTDLTVRVASEEHAVKDGFTMYIYKTNLL